jgi:hypothetical protein
MQQVFNTHYRNRAVILALLVNVIAMLLVLPRFLQHESDAPLILQRYTLDYFIALVLYIVGIIGQGVLFFF